MKAASGLETRRDAGGVRLLESAQRQLDALRATIDVRLAELDAALANPSRAASLTGLIVELARLATSEAQAAATRACLQIRSDGEASMLEAEARNLAAVEAERKLASELRKNLDRVQTRLDLLETEKHAVLQAAREQTQLLEAERASRGALNRTITRLEREVTDAQARVLEEGDAAERAAIERTHAVERAASLERQLAAAQTSAVHAGELERQLAEAKRRVEEVEQQLTATRVTVTSLDAERAVSGDRIAALERELEAAHETVTREQAAACTAAEQRSYAEACLRQQEPQLAERAREQDRLRIELDAAERALSQAAEAEAAQRAAVASAAAELATERQARAELLAQVDSLTHLLDAERSVAADLRHAISAGSTAAEGEQQAVATLLQAAADAEQPAADLRMAHSTAQAAADAAAEALAQERQFAADLQRQYAELEQARQDAARVHSNLVAVQQRLASLEQARAHAEEAAIEAGERVAIVERERDAFSLALDTERMTTANLRQAVSGAERRVAEASSELEDLRQQLTTTRTGPARAQAQAADDEDGEVTELTFDEDRVEESGDGAITLDQDGWESVRLSTRYTFTSRIDIKVNGVAGVLCDLSVGGCGVRTTATLEAGDAVRVQLPQDPHTLLCLGEVIWARKEPASGRVPAGIRAGIRFTQADEGALEAFIIMRADV